MIDQEVFSKLAEVDMIVADLDRANTRIATVERRNEILRAEIETLRSGNEASDRYAILPYHSSPLTRPAIPLALASNAWNPKSPN